jgi:hypothetical protein
MREFGESTRMTVHSLLHQFGLCGSDPDRFIDELEAEGIVFIDVKNPEPKIESGIVEHARVELELIGEESDTVDGYLRVLQAFADMGHSGGSASVVIPVLFELLCQKNLRPLTDDPDEWIFHDKAVWGAEGGIWQNNRNGEAFSHDAGKTYYILSERRKKWYSLPRRKWHKSEPSRR